MSMRPCAALLCASLLTLALMPRPLAAQAASDTASETGRLHEHLARALAASHVRDSLEALAGRADGETRRILDEQVWQQHLEVHSRVMEVAGELSRLKAAGVEPGPAAAIVQEALRAGWPPFRRMLERFEEESRRLQEERNAATGSSRLALESRITRQGTRIAGLYRDLVEVLLALEPLGVDVSEQRSFAGPRLSATAERLAARITVLQSDLSHASDRVARRADDAAARDELEAVQEALGRATNNLEAAISLLDRLGAETTSLKVSLIAATGRLNADILRPGVAIGLIRHWRVRFFDFVGTNLSGWLFRVIGILVILGAFRLLAGLVRRGVRRAVARSPVSQLLRDTLTSWSFRLVMLIGLVVVLRQLGVELGPMLAGLGIAGFVLGFALQSTLSNFAAGGMILAYRPFDVGDDIEAAGVSGVVKTMSLVSTTILTLDNQTLIIPNGRIWGDVIRNRSTQATRRVDLTFETDHGDDVTKVERILGEIVGGNDKVLKDPAPVIRLHQLRDSSVGFVVRVWTPMMLYWDVYWELTRAVKLRFDQEGIQVPFPRHEVHLKEPRAGTRQEGSRP